MEFYYEEKSLKHLIKRLEPLITTKINWCKTGIKIPIKDKVIDRLVSDLKYMLENPESFKDKQNEFQCVCIHNDKCCECGKELIEDDYECGPEPFTDEMHDFYILHRRCPKCEQKKMLKARDFIKNFDDPFEYKVSISDMEGKICVGEAEGMIEKEDILHNLNILHQGVTIEWDRVVETPNYIDVFGWIPEIRKDDFILVRFEEIKKELYISFTTSSAKYSKQIAENLNCEIHDDCIKFKEYFGDMICQDEEKEVSNTK